jgi:pimeloyl-ACP methyl ester carboxylesterase
MIMVKPRLLLLSDLFGGESPEWIKSYSKTLASKFDVHYYDVLKLGGINASDCDESGIHSQFLKGGIDRAVQTLLDFEKEEVTILGFSIGGTIGWKASLLGLKVKQLVAVSSTRLRFETEIPNCKIKLYFGENDRNKPNAEWFSDLNVSNYVFENQEHQLYLIEKNTVVICSEL